MNKNYGSSFSDIKDKLKNSEFDRTFTLWSVNEDEELLRLYLKEKLTNLEISKKLRRTLGSIRARLKLHGHPNKNIINFGIQFADYIKEGINPITGEILNEDSAWRHPKILDDLENYIGISKSNKYKTKKFSSVETNKLIDKERPVFYELMIQIKKFIPKISDRDAELIAYHYDPSSEKKSLQDTANKFTMSRERVRQIRDKTLRKLKFAIKTRKFTFVKLNSVKPDLLARKEAVNYLNQVLEMFHNNQKDNNLSSRSKNDFSPNVGLKWTKNEEQKLIFLWKKGNSIRDIAIELGRLSGGIKSRLRKKGYLD